MRVTMACSPLARLPLRCEPSSSTSKNSGGVAMISSGVRFSVSMGSPMTTRISPGYLMKLWRGQYSPALWAMGMTGTPVSAARMAPPMR